VKCSPLLLAGLFLLACSNRERSNPLDPNNPATHGAPSGFQVVANRDTVRLWWHPVNVKELSGYHIYRSISGDPLGFHRLVAPDSTYFEETQLMYDRTYIYAVQAVTQAGESRLSRPDTLVPGPHNFWIAGFNNSTVWRIGYDGAHIVKQHYFSSPEAIACQHNPDIIWIADYYEQVVYQLDVHFNLMKRIDLTGYPIEIAADNSTGDIFVLQRRPDQIYRISLNGDIIGAYEVPDYASVHTTLTFNESNSWLWFINPVSASEGKVYRYQIQHTGSAWELIAQTAYPYRVATASPWGGCWVATDSGVVHIDPSGNLTTHLSHMQVLDISLNPTNGDCYFTARSHEDHRWQTGRLSEPSGFSVDPILDETYGSLTRIQALLGEGRVGFLVHQISTNQILRFNPDGQLIGRLGGFYGAPEITLE
jgi:hypothetical protein